MLFWLFCAVMTAAVVYAVTRPLLASRSDRLDAAEAEAARIEISRRLLARAEAEERSPARRAGPDAAKIALAATTAGVPLAALALYLAVGSPGLPNQPYAQRSALKLENASVAQLVERVEARLRERPEDGKGWDVIAPVYLTQQRYQDAALAFANAIRLLGESTKRLAGFAEATVLANNGIITEEARLAYEKVLRIGPGLVEARFWVALAKEQDGDLDRAAQDYQGLLAEAPAQAPWRSAVEERLKAVRSRLGAGPAPTPPGPTAEDVD